MRSFPISYKAKVAFYLHGRYIVAIILLISLIYSKSLSGSFLWDDEEQIVNNYLIHDISNILDFFGGSTFNTGGADVLTGVYYRPIMMVFFSMAYYIFGLNSFSYHALQIVFHSFVSVIVYFVFLGIYQKSEQYLTDKKYFRRVCAFLALLFSIHPLNVETVSYISAVQDILYTLFGICAIFAVSSAKIAQKKHFLISFICLTLAMFSKESAVIFVFIFIAYGLIMDLSKRYSYIFVSLSVAAMYFLVRLTLINVPFGKYDISPISALSLYERVITIPKVIFYYISNFFYPDNLTVMQHWVVMQPTFWDFWLPLFAVICASVVVVFFTIKYRSKELMFFGIWSMLSLGMHSQIYPLDMTVATRWIYSGLVGMVGVVAFFILTFIRKYEKRHNIAIYLFIAVILGLGLRSFVRQEAWQNGYLLYSTDISRNPDSFDLNNNYGVELFRNGGQNESLKFFEKSIKLQPNWPFAWNNAGAIYERNGDLEKAKKYYKKSIEIGDYHLAYENYTNILIKQQKYDDARVFLDRALQILPRNERLNQYKNQLQNLK